MARSLILPSLQSISFQWGSRQGYYLVRAGFAHADQSKTWWHSCPYDTVLRHTRRCNFYLETSHLSQATSTSVIRTGIVDAASFLSEWNHFLSLKGPMAFCTTFYIFKLEPPYTYESVFVRKISNFDGAENRLYVRHGNENRGWKQFPKYIFFDGILKPTREILLQLFLEYTERGICLIKNFLVMNNN